jgi:hypothetical protein
VVVSASISTEPVRLLMLSARFEMLIVDPTHSFAL